MNPIILFCSLFSCDYLLMCRAHKYVYPYPMLDSPDYFLSNYCASFCKWMIQITQQSNTEYPSNVQYQRTNITENKRSFKENWPLETWNLWGNQNKFLGQSKHRGYSKQLPLGLVSRWICHENQIDFKNYMIFHKSGMLKQR